MAIKSLSSINVLTNTDAVCLSATSNAAITVSKVLATNTDTVARVVNVWHDVTGGAGAINGTLVLKSYPLSPGETKTLPLSSLFVVNGGKLYADADVTGVVNLDINYTVTEQTP